MENYDCIIIGAGPAGLSSALYLSRAGKKTLILGNIYDSTCAKAGMIWNYPPLKDGVSGIDWVKSALEHAKKFGSVNITENAVEIKKEKKEFIVKTNSLKEFRSKAVVIATGSAHKKAGIKGEKELLYKGVSYCAVCDAPLFKDKDIILYGSGPRIGSSAVLLKNIVRKLVVITPEKELGIESNYLNEIKKSSNTAVITDKRIKEIEGKERVEGIVLENGDKITCKGVFIEMGSVPSSIIAESIGIKTNEKGEIKVKYPEMKTNVKGIFSAGDVTEGVKQIGKAVGDGINSAMSVLMFLKSS